MVEEMCARKVEAYVEASLRNLSEIGRKVTLHDNRSSIDAGKRNVTRERSYSLNSKIIQRTIQRDDRLIDILR